jgi:nucleoside-diphosphate-sugar epimerase
MVIGNGLIAKAFDKYIIFASGVSDSSCKDIAQFKREENLLSQYLDKGTVVYFSTVSNDSTAYVEHKRRMESMVINSKGVVLKLSQVVGMGGNKNNLFNNLRKSLHTGVVDVAEDTTRGLVDIKDVVYLTNFIRCYDLKGMYYLTGQVMSVNKIVELMGEAMNVHYSINSIPSRGYQIEQNDLVEFNDIETIIKTYV